MGLPSNHRLRAYVKHDEHCGRSVAEVEEQHVHNSGLAKTCADGHLRRLGSFTMSAGKLVRPHPYSSTVFSMVSPFRTGSSVKVGLSATDRTVSPCEAWSP